MGQTVGRILILLTIVSAVIFVIVLGLPLASRTQSVFSANEIPGSQRAVVPIKKVQPPARKPAAQKPVTPKGRRDHSPLIPHATGRELAVPSLEHPALVQEKGWAIVSSDSAALYSVNSSGGQALQILEKGQLVRTDLEVIDPEGRWTLVKTPDRRTIGYIRSENLSEAPAMTARR